MGGRFVPAVLSFDLADFYSRALGPFAIKICRHLHSNVHRLVRPYLFGAAMVGRADELLAPIKDVRRELAVFISCHSPPTGAEGKRSFPGSSLPSFLSRKRAARRDTRGPIGRVFKSGGPPGRGGPAVGPWARPGASIAARRRPGRTAALPLRLSSYAAGSCPVPPVFESEESS